MQKSGRFRGSPVVGNVGSQGDVGGPSWQLRKARSRASGWRAIGDVGEEAGRSCRLGSVLGSGKNSTGLALMAGPIA